MKRDIEDTPAEKRADKAGAKKAKMPVAAWEKSGGDRKADIRAAMKVGKKK